MSVYTQWHKDAAEGGKWHCWAEGTDPSVAALCDALIDEVTGDIFQNDPPRHTCCATCLQIAEG